VLVLTSTWRRERRGGERPGFQRCRATPTPTRGAREPRITPSATAHAFSRNQQNPLKEDDDEFVDAIIDPPPVLDVALRLRNGSSRHAAAYWW
jgi:hypothetical protein